MTESNKPEENTPESEQTFTKSQVDEMINHKLNHIVGQLKERDTKLREYEQTQSQLQAQADEANRKKMEEDGKLKELLEATEKKFNDERQTMAQQIAALNNNLTTTQLKHAFASNGLNDEIKQLGYITLYNNIEGEKPAPAEWIEKLKAENPDSFKTVTRSQGSTSFGSVDQHVPDPSVDKLTAAREKLKSVLGA